MRTYGRINQNPDGAGGQWVEVDPDPAGFDDPVWVTTLIQCLKLELGESPFFAQYGIPAQRSILTQVFPDFYVAQTQRQFSDYFGSLIVAKIAGRDPHYRVNITTQQGTKIIAKVAV